MKVFIIVTMFLLSGCNVFINSVVTNESKPSFCESKGGVVSCIIPGAHYGSDAGECCCVTAVSNIIIENTCTEFDDNGQPSGLYTSEDVEEHKQNMGFYRISPR